MRRDKPPFWLVGLALFSYLLLFGSGIPVFFGTVYVLFFAPLSTVDPSSLNSSSPLGEKIADLAFLVAILVFGYVVNRLAWGRAFRHYAERNREEEE